MLKPQTVQAVRCQLVPLQRVADLRQFLLPGFFAFGEVFVISFRLLKSIFSLPIRPVFAAAPAVS